MRFVLAAWFLLSAGVALAAPGDGFTYKGVKLGDPVEAVKEKLPTYECSGSTCDYSMRLCARKMDRAACDASASFGGAWITLGVIRVHDGKVIGVSLNFTQPMIAAASDAATQAFGHPVSSEVKELQTRAGAKFPSWSKTWVIADQTLQISQRSGDIETGVASITSSEGGAILEQERNKQATKGSKDF